jgi:hypothetical protein
LATLTEHNDIPRVSAAGNGWVVGIEINCVRVRASIYHVRITS